MRAWWSATAGAFGFLTVVPVPQRWLPDKPGKMFAAFPVVGLLIGIMLWGVASLTVFPPGVVAVLALLVWVALTGGLHLDGLGDSCDGLFATTTPERRLEIMKDPRAGSWAVVGICLLLLGKWVALPSVAPALLILPPVMGRWAMVLTVWRFPDARTSGTSVFFRDGFGTAHVITATIIAVLVLAVAGAGVDRRAFDLVVIAPIVAPLVGSWAARRLGGGVTGDVYGAVCELTELVSLLVLCAR